MASGHIRDFRKPDQAEKQQTQVLSQVRGAGVQIEQPEQIVEVNVHEEVIREDQSNVRKPGESDGIEIRLRHAKNPKAWDDVKRGDA